MTARWRWCSSGSRMPGATATISMRCCVSTTAGRSVFWTCSRPAVRPLIPILAAALAKPVPPRSDPTRRLLLDPSKRTWAAAGAASGLAAVAKAALCLDQQIIPGLGRRGRVAWFRGAVPAAVFHPAGPQFWMRNRSEGPRRAAIAASNLAGNSQLVVLEEAERESGASRASRSATSPRRRQGLFAIEAGDRAGLVGQVHALATRARAEPARDIDSLARQWWTDHPNDPRLKERIAIVADGVESLEHL